MRWLVVTWAAVAGAVVGAIFGFTAFGPFSPHPADPAEVYPLPHQVPKYPGGTSLRLAMVHDVLHERFARHGKAYFEARKQRTRRQLAEDKKLSSEQTFDLLDDLGASLDNLGEHDEAVRVLRDKLREQQRLGLTGGQYYTTYANLGTFLIHGNLPAAQAGDAKAKERLREGLGFVQKSIEVKPMAHFGREVWQAVFVEFLLAAMDDPQLLLKYDMVGDSLEISVDPVRGRCMNESGLMLGTLREAEAILKDLPSHIDREGVRRSITTVGAEGAWAKDVRSGHKEFVPFDEPALGIVGMWRQGGANSHFTLALGEILLRVGQRPIAWCAYERAAGMAEDFWPDPEIRRRFVAHCRGRQSLIEADWPNNKRASLRPRFEEELAFGRQYQKDYQEYEARQIAAGAAPGDGHFYDAFHARHGPIASPVGRADTVPVVPRLTVADRLLWLLYPLSWAVFFAGLFAFVAARGLRRAARPRLPAADDLGAFRPAGNPSESLRRAEDDR